MDESLYLSRNEKMKSKIEMGSAYNKDGILSKGLKIQDEERNQLIRNVK